MKLDDLKSFYAEVAEIEASIAECLSELDEYHALMASQLDEFRGQMEVRDPPMDEKLTLFEAVCLPELGGILFANGNNIQAANLAVSTLRDEMKAGRLRRVPPFNKNHFVSRRTIKEWIEWQESVTHQSLPSCQSTETRTAASRSPSGRSNISTRELDAKKQNAQALALAKAQKLKNTLRNG
jgi:hypothetical protein